MSWPEVEGKWPHDRGDGNDGNVVPLPTTAGRAASAARQAHRPGPDAGSRGAAGRDGGSRDGISRDGLDLLRAFFAIADGPARAAVLLMAQHLASHPGKR